MPVENKKPWLSKTVIINALVGLSVALSPFIPGLAGVQPFIAANLGMISMLWGALNIALRFISKGAISLED